VAVAANFVTGLAGSLAPAVHADEQLHRNIIFYSQRYPPGDEITLGTVSDVKAGATPVTPSSDLSKQSGNYREIFPLVAKCVPTRRVFGSVL
jgi:hypothetical protein